VSQNADNKDTGPNLPSEIKVAYAKDTTPAPPEVKIDYSMAMPPDRVLTLLARMGANEEEMSDFLRKHRNLPEDALRTVYNIFWLSGVHHVVALMLAPRCEDQVVELLNDFVRLQNKVVRALKGKKYSQDKWKELYLEVDEKVGDPIMFALRCIGVYYFVTIDFVPAPRKQGEGPDITVKY